MLALMTEPQQSFQNHARIIPLYHYFVFGALTLNLAWAIRRLADAPAFGTIVAVLTAAALILLALFARSFALRAQDRVIRLEMRMRMKDVLPPALQSRIHDFTPGQLVALRFASDAELPELAERVLRENLQNKKAIKQLIKVWNPDHLRV